MKVNPFKEWLKTEEGKGCADWYSLRFGKEPQKYLENRLYHAYSAGLISEYNRSKTIDATLEWYEQKKRESDKLIKELQATIERLKSECQPPQSESEQSKLASSNECSHRTDDSHDL